MNQVPTKIVLKSTTRMSLNDRFSTIIPNVQTIRANVAADHQVSSANKRLAQQLANRPGISQFQAANMMYNNNNNWRGQGRGRRGMPLLQRGAKVNVKARLTLPGNRGQLRGGQGGRGGNQMAGGGGDASWNMAAVLMSRGRGALFSRSPRGRGTFRGGRGQQFNRMTGQAVNIVRGRGGQMNRGGRARGISYNNQPGGAGSGGRGRGRGRGGVRGAQRGGARGGQRGGVVSVDELNSQLDQYMSKTKSALDTELDQYMAQSS